MNYIVFPFGKYKGYLIKDLPSTYIVLALEQFELPNELVSELRLHLLSRLGVYKNLKELLNDNGLKKTIIILNNTIDGYEDEINKVKAPF